MKGIVAINGQIFDIEQASIPVTDRGFLYGDSVYEVIRTYRGIPFALEEHLERLARSAELVQIPLPLSLDQQKEEIERALAAAGEGEWYIRLILTRGGGPFGLDPALADTPRRVIIIVERPRLPERFKREGVSVALIQTGRSTGGAIPSGAKTGNYLTNILSLGQARAKGAFEAIMIDGQGRIAEGTTSNVFVLSHGALRTPPLGAGILDGITRRKVIDLSLDAGIEVVQEHLRPLDVYSADEVFLTSTLKEILPVTEIDGVKVGDGRPGPVTTRLRYMFEAMTREQ